MTTHLVLKALNAFANSRRDRTAISVARAVLRGLGVDVPTIRFWLGQVALQTDDLPAYTRIEGSDWGAAHRA